MMCAHRDSSKGQKRGLKTVLASAAGCLVVFLLCAWWVVGAAGSDMVGISGEILVVVAKPNGSSGEITIGYRFLGVVKASDPAGFETAVSLDEAWITGFSFLELTGSTAADEGFLEDVDFVETFHRNLLVDGSLSLQVGTQVVLTLPELSQGSTECLYNHYIEKFGGMMLDLGSTAIEFAESLHDGVPESCLQAVLSLENAVIAVLFKAGGVPKVPIVGERHRVEYRRVVLRAHPHPASRPTAEMEYGDEYTVLSVWVDPDDVYWLQTEAGWMRRGSVDVPWF